MGEHRVQSEVVLGAAKVRVHTYRYATPSEQTRSPTQHVLTLFTSRLSPDSHGFYNSDGARMLRFGELIFVPAGTSIYGAGPGGERSMVSYCLQKGASKALRGLEDGLDSKALAHCGDMKSPTLSATMRRMGQEAAEPGFASDLMLDGLAGALEVDLARYIQGCAPNAAQHCRGGLAPRQLRVLEDYVRARHGGGLKAAELAAVIGVSRGHLMRAFRQSRGVSLMGFVEQVRLERAKTLLTTGNSPLKRIADELGFSSASSFSLAFRRGTMTTPAQFRRGVAH